MSEMTDLLNSTGKRIKLLRHDLDLTQEELRRRLHLAGVDIHQSYISSLERSNSLPSGEVLAGLAKVLGTTADYLLLLSDDPLIPGEPDEDARTVTDDEWSLVTALRSLPDADRLGLLEMIQGMIDVAVRQRQRTGRPLTDTVPRTTQVPRVPRSREDLVALLSVLPDSVLDELAGVAGEIIRKSARTA